MDLLPIVKIAVLFLSGIAWTIHLIKYTRALNRRSKELKRQWEALDIRLEAADIQMEEGEGVLSESRQLQIIAEEPMLIEKLERMEALSIQLGKLLGNSIFMLGKSLGQPEGTWSLDVTWSSLSDDRCEVTYIVLQKRVKGWVRSKWQRVMVYQRYYGTDIRTGNRIMYEFDNSVVAELDTLSDELEQKIARAAKATKASREQFRKVVEEHPRERKNRFDQIDPLP